TSARNYEIRSPDHQTTRISTVRVGAREDAVRAAEGQGADGRGWVNRAAGDEGRAVADVEVRHVPGLMIGVSNRGGRIVAHATGAEQVPCRAGIGDAVRLQLQRSSRVGQLSGTFDTEFDDLAVVWMNIPRDGHARKTAGVVMVGIEGDTVLVDREIFGLDAEPDLVIEEFGEG